MDINIYLELIELQKKYEDKNYKKIEPIIVNGIMVNKNYYYPSNWYQISDDRFKIDLLKKALSMNVPLEELEEIKKIDVISKDNKKL